MEPQNRIVFLKMVSLVREAINVNACGRQMGNITVNLARLRVGNWGRDGHPKGLPLLHSGMLLPYV